MVEFSAVTGTGTAELLAAIDAELAGAPARDGAGAARMPVDRVFTAEGFGSIRGASEASPETAAWFLAEVGASGPRPRGRIARWFGSCQTARVAAHLLPSSGLVRI